MVKIEKGKRGRTGGAGAKRRKQKNACDATEILTWIAISFMLYRIVYLLRVFRKQTDSVSSPSTAFKDRVDYSKIGGVRTTSGRTFLKYSASPWEQKWSDFIDLYEKMGAVCNQIRSDSDLISMFFNATCSGIAIDDHIKPDHRGWCVIDDGVAPVFYNRINARVSGSKPAALKSNNVEFTQNQPIIIADDFNPVFSKFTYRDDKTKLICKCCTRISLAPQPCRN